MIEFINAMQSAGLEPPGEIVPGKFYRFPGTGKSRGNTSGWCKLFPDGTGGVYGDFSTDLSESWHQTRDISPADRAEYRRKVVAARKEAEQQREREQEAAASEAVKVWQSAAAVQGHPYLDSKGVRSHGLREKDGALIIPLFADGSIKSVQRIFPDGKKRFLPNGRTKGCYFLIGEPSETVYICEGYATAATVHEATGQACAVAFNAGNLKPVSEAIQSVYKARIVMAADNDPVGIEKASGGTGEVLAPPEAGDWNDYMQKHGRDALKPFFSADSEPLELTDTGNAQRFARKHGDTVRYVPAWGWLHYNGKHWNRSSLQVRKLMMETALEIHHEAANCKDQAQQKAVSEWARKSQHSSRIEGALYLAQPYLEANTEQFDRDPWLLPVSNGTLDLRSGSLKPHSQNHNCTKLVPVTYSDSATCPKWLAFLERVLPDPEIRQFFQRLVGYSITGSTEEQVLAFLYGAGRNGKSVAVETLAELLGDYHSATRSESLSITRGGGIPNDIAALAGARLVTVSETPEGARLNESLVKDLTGGDLMSARFLRHEFFKFRPKFKLWIRGNHKPQIRGTDDGIWRRICLIPFTVQIPEQEVDPKLAEKLITELPGILNWAVQGCLAWQEQGLNAPDSIKNAVKEYRSEMDILGEFFSECCIVDPSLSCSAKELHREYKRWCEDYGHKVIEQHRFGRALRERGFEKTKPKTVIWHGIGLLSDHSDLSALSRSSSYTRAHNTSNAEKRAQSSERAEYCPQCDGEGCTWCTSAEGVAA